MSAMHWMSSLVWRLVVIGFTKVKSSQRGREEVVAREEAKVVEECLKCARWEKARMVFS